jgi:hypothetical protein
MERQPSQAAFLVVKQHFACDKYILWYVIKFCWRYFMRIYFVPEALAKISFLFVI